MRFQVVLFSNLSTLIAYWNVYIFMIVFIVSLWTESENAKISLCFQMKTDPCNRDLSLLEAKKVFAWALGYVYTGSDMFSDSFRIGSTMVRIHSIYTGPFRNWNGTVPYGIKFIWYQTADPIHIRSPRFRINTRLICTNFEAVPNGSGPV